MKLTHSPQHRNNRGSVLVVILVTIVVLGVVLAAVLSLIVQENRILARTSTWNSTLPVAEAGIEEAMSHLEQVDGGPRGVNGWTATGSSFVLTRTNLSDGRYTVAISGTVPPVILSVGQIWCPSAGSYIQRRVKVTTLGRGIFNKGLVAQSLINLSGTFGADSFDSQKPELSTGGQYDPAKHSDNGDIGTNLSQPGAITISGTVDIYGKVATGPLGTVDIGSGSSVGTTNWVDGGNTGIEPGRYQADMNVSFPSADQPYTNNVTPPSGTVDGTNYTYVLDTADYTLDTLKLATKSMYVRGNARLVVLKDLSLSGSAQVIIATNASLELFLASGSASLTGDSIVNGTGVANNFNLVGSTNVSTIKISGNGEYVGTIYAPDSDLKLSGSGSDVLDFMGAAIINTVQGIGKFEFHYDESLGYDSTNHFIINSWREL